MIAMGYHKKLTDEEIAKLPLAHQRDILGSRERRKRKRYVYFERARERRRANRLALCDILGSRVCVNCGFSDIRALQFDHINGLGRQTMLTAFKQPSLRDKILQYYIKNPELARKTFQVLCANCNWIKRHENKEHYDPRFRPDKPDLSDYADLGKY